MNFIAIRSVAAANADRTPDSRKERKRSTSRHCIPSTPQPHPPPPPLAHHRVEPPVHHRYPAAPPSQPPPRNPLCAQPGRRKADPPAQNRFLAASPRQPPRHSVRAPPARHRVEPSVHHRFQGASPRQPPPPLRQQSPKTLLAKRERERERFSVRAAAPAGACGPCAAPNRHGRTQTSPQPRLTNPAPPKRRRHPRPLLTTLTPHRGRNPAMHRVPPPTQSRPQSISQTHPTLYPPQPPTTAQPPTTRDPPARPARPRLSFRTVIIALLRAIDPATEISGLVALRIVVMLRHESGGQIGWRQATGRCRCRCHTPLPTSAHDKERSRRAPPKRTQRGMFRDSRQLPWTGWQAANDCLRG